jgi:hypothetical protein
MPPESSPPTVTTIPSMWAHRAHRGTTLIRRVGAAVLLVAAISTAAAHTLAIPPSSCALDPVTFERPVSGVTGSAASATDADAVRILYDPAEGRIQVCSAPASSGQCGPAAARAFSLGSVAGTFALPPVFPGRMLATGDIMLDTLPVTFAVGADVRTVEVSFTTALAAAAGRVVEGAPLHEVDTFTLVGVADGAGLPTSLAGEPLVMRITCVPDPTPDEDEFTPTPAISRFHGRIGGRSKLRWTVVPLSRASVDFHAKPAMLAIGVDGSTAVAAVFSAGLAGERRLTATSDDGKTVLVVRPTSKGFTVAVQIDGVTLPAGSSAGRADAAVTMDLAGLLERIEAPVHVVAGGRARSR